MTDTITTDRFRRTRPWTHDEFLYVDGQAFVYTMRRTGEMLVHLPGGVSVTLPELRERKARVVFPARFRFHGDD